MSINGDDIQRVLIVGAGAIGRQIAVQCASHGFNVTLCDKNQNSLGSAVNECRDLFKALGDQKQLTAEEISSAMARIQPTCDPRAAAADADLLIEAVPEQLQLKREVFSEFHQYCPPRTLFTTNTSMLLPSMLAASTGRPAQFAAFHFLMESELVEIMPHAGSSTETIEALQAVARRLGHVAITCHREQPGYLVNTMLMALNASALTLAANGVASIEDIDRGWMKGVNVDRGPFGILDVVGIDTAWQITEYGAKWIKNPQTKKNADYLKQYVDQGFLGVKSGRGFYTYPNPAYRQPEFLEVVQEELPGEFPAATQSTQRPM